MLKKDSDIPSGDRALLPACHITLTHHAGLNLLVLIYMIQAQRNIILRRGFLGLKKNRELQPWEN
jgi:hypothetical protein